jgi:choline dehydrogenase
VARSGRAGGADEFDFVLVGAGTAGCLLADRLTRSGRFRVALIEAGGTDRRFMIRMPIGYGHSFFNPRVNWMYSTGPQEALGGRSSYWPRGKVLGGSSAINAMVFVRGQRRDFDDWAAAGNPGWGWADVLPHFKSFERFHGPRSDERGTDGPLDVADVSDRVHPLCEAFLGAAEGAGFPRTPDYNGEGQEGVGAYQITVRNGVRASAASAFLRPAMRRGNLEVVANAFVTRILVEDGRAAGVEYERGGRRTSLRAGREVILAAGAVNSPALLLHSGIGPAGALRDLGIDVRRDLPAVGANLQDHLGIDYLYRSRVPTLNGPLRSWTGRGLMGARYLLRRDGPFSLSVNQAGGFVRTEPDLPHVDMQLYFSPVSYSRPTPGIRRLTLPDGFPGFFIGLSQCRPKSTGMIRIVSRDPRVAPSIEPNYFGDPDDMEEMLRGVRLLRRLAGQPPLRDVIDAELMPGAGATDRDALEADIRERAGSVFHACGTCRIGPDETGAVVDGRLRVHGMPGLRVIDASVFPNVTSGNTNAPTYMVAAKGAGMVLDDNR